MSLSTVLYLFLAHLGVGIAATLVFVARGAGVKFFRFNAGLSAILIAVGVAFHHNGASPVAVERTDAPHSPRPLKNSSIVLQALGVSAHRALPVQALTVASFLTSAALLGGACTAMILGHWYLVIPSMEVSHLQSIVKLHIASLVLRVAVVSAAIIFAIATWEPGMGPSFRHYIMSASGIFFWQRTLFGLAGPALLSYLTWETAKIRSTQSATGILYVDFFTVVVGEALAKYIVLATRVPV